MQNLHLLNIDLSLTVSARQHTVFRPQFKKSLYLARPPFPMTQAKLNKYCTGSWTTQEPSPRGLPDQSAGPLETSESRESTIGFLHLHIVPRPASTRLRSVLLGVSQLLR